MNQASATHAAGLQECGVGRAKHPIPNIARPLGRTVDFHRAIEAADVEGGADVAHLRDLESGLALSLVVSTKLRAALASP
ncbi:MAG: hypothetical protein JNN30_12520 [Rhodanobacteraceae bacterium]|nr:hypothetical protein [Rhodanobacteraceae bacterium]